MTRKEAWVQFMAGALAQPGADSVMAARRADAALHELYRRWPPESHNDNDPPVKVPVEVPPARRFVHDERT